MTMGAAEQRCECCDLPTYSCGKAKEAAQRHAQDAERRALVRAGWIPAHYRGFCVRCGQPFNADALIRYAGNGSWRAECCADGAP
ncbi:MAG: hypothetical protein ACREN2_13445 [Candidatus Dormibacteria bacterium]